MRVRVQHRVQRHTLLSSSAQRFLFRNRKRLSESEFTMLLNEFIEICSNSPNRTILGQVCHADSATTWRNVEFVQPSNTTLLSHQRNMLDHLLENEEMAMLIALGLNFDYAPLVLGSYELCKEELSYNCSNGRVEFVLYSADSPFQMLIGSTANNFCNNIRFYVLAETAEQLELVRLYATCSLDSITPESTTIALEKSLLVLVDLCSLNTKVEHRYLNWVQLFHITHIQCANSFRRANIQHYELPSTENITRRYVIDLPSVCPSRPRRVLTSLMRSISPLSRAASIAANATVNPLTNIAARHAARLTPYQRTSARSFPASTVPTVNLGFAHNENLDSQPSLLRRPNSVALQDSENIEPNVQPNVHAVQPNVHAVQPNVHAVQPNVHAVQLNVHNVQPNVHNVQPNVHNVQSSMQGVEPQVQSIEQTQPAQRTDQVVASTLSEDVPLQQFRQIDQQYQDDRPQPSRRMDRQDQQMDQQVTSSTQLQDVSLQATRPQEDLRLQQNTRQSQLSASHPSAQSQPPLVSPIFQRVSLQGGRLESDDQLFGSLASSENCPIFNRGVSVDSFPPTSFVPGFPVPDNDRGNQAHSPQPVSGLEEPQALSSSMLQLLQVDPSAPLSSPVPSQSAQPRIVSQLFHLDSIRVSVTPAVQRSDSDRIPEIHSFLQDGLIPMDVDESETPRSRNSLSENLVENLTEHLTENENLTENSQAESSRSEPSESANENSQSPTENFPLLHENSSSEENSLSPRENSHELPPQDLRVHRIDMPDEDVIPPSPQATLWQHNTYTNFLNAYDYGTYVNFVSQDPQLANFSGLPSSSSPTSLQKFRPGNLSCSSCPNCDTPFSHITDRQSLVLCTVPRGFLKTIIADSSGSGKTFTVLSLCMHEDSRNNWIMIRSAQLPSWREHCLQYSTCKFFVMASLNDVNMFYSTRRDPRIYDPGFEYNVILIVSSMITYTTNKFPRPYRLFVDDNDLALANIISGQYNYILSPDLTPANIAYIKSSSTNLLQTHDSCIENLFDLPSIYYSNECTSRPKKVWNFECNIDFCIDLGSGNKVNNEALFRHVLFGQEYYSMSKLVKAIKVSQRDISELRKVVTDPENDTNLISMRSIVESKEKELKEAQGNIAYQTDRILTGNCIICFCREFDYVVTHCCRNNICCECLVKIDRSRCPYCRQELDVRNSFTPVILDKTNNSPSSKISDYFIISPIQLAVRFVSKLLDLYRQHNEKCSSSDNRNWCVAHPLKIVLCTSTNISVVSDLLPQGIRRYKTTHAKQVAVFRSTPEPSIFLLANSNKAFYYDLPFVTHVILVGEVNPILAQSLLTRANRYGRKYPLQVQQFISFEHISIREYLISRGKDCPRVLRDIVSDNTSNGSYLILDNYLDNQ